MDHPKREYLLDQEQYNRLKRCVLEKDIREWNRWRKANPKVDILLGPMKT